MSAAAAAVAEPDLIALARSRGRDDHARLLLGVADLCARAPECGRGALNPDLEAVFLTLAAKAERDIRKALAERLADADWPPPTLVSVLAHDEIEIARPLIATSPVLRDADLLGILVEAAIEHRLEVAQRRDLSAAVVEAVVAQGEPAVMTALAANVTADVSPEMMGRLVDAAERTAALRAPLARHERLTRALAEQLYRFVGTALRQAMAKRFALDTPALNAEIEAAVRDAHDAGAFGDGRRERDDVEARLVAKLTSAGRLTAGYGVRALRERNLNLFQHTLAALGGFEPQAIRDACAAASPRPLALACVAVGIDPVVFPSLAAMVRTLAGLRPWEDAVGAGDLPAEAALAAEAFRAELAPA